MIYVIAGLVILCVIEGVLLIQYSSMLHTVRERLLRQIRMNNSLKMKLQTKVTMIPMDKQTTKEVMVRLKNLTTEPVVMTGHFEMPIEMTEVK